MYSSVALGDSPRADEGMTLRVATSKGSLLSQDTPLGSPVGVETANEVARKRSANAFIPVVCSIFGVIIFMRLGLIVGTVGLLRAWAIVTVAFGITVLSIGSLSALASSRGLDRSEERGFYASMLCAVGTRGGGAIGGLLFLAFSLASAYYLLGFAEISVFYLGISSKKYPLPWNESGSWIVVAIASATLALLTLALLLGYRISKRKLMVVFGIVIVSIGCNVLFLMVQNNSTQTGLSSAFLRGNLPGHAPQLSLKMFGEFFPAFCGVLAGANLADDLTNFSPRRHGGQHNSAYLIVGIHKAIAFSCLIYGMLSLVLASCVENGNLRRERFVVQMVVDSILGIPVIYLGVAATTITSALSNTMSAASIYRTTYCLLRIDENVGRHSIALSSPGFGIFLAWFLCQTAIACGSVDTIIPIIGSTFLFTFAVVNFACFFHEIISPNFSATFVMYSKWSALLGFCLSIGCLFLVMSTFFVGCLIVGLVGALLFFQSTFPDFVENIRAQELNSAELNAAQANNGVELLFEYTTDPLVSSTTRSNLNHQDRKKLIELAALYVRDALHGRFLGEEYVTEALHKLEYKRWYHALQFVRMGNMAVLLGLSFFEVPSWCYFSLSCGDPQHTLMWEMPTLPREATFVIELLNLSILAAEAALKYQYLGTRLYFANKWHVVQMVLLISDAISIVLVAIVSQDNGSTSTEGDEQVRVIILSPLLRPLLLLTMSDRLRSGFMSLLRVLPRVMDGLLTVLVLIVIYSISGMVMFEGTDEGRQYFPDFGTAWMSMLILLTTANFPDVMMPAYARARYASIFFMSFLMIGLLLMMNLVFASIYQNYRHEVSQRATMYSKRRQKSLEFAFELLPGEYVKGAGNDYEKVISRSTFEALISELLRPVFSFIETPGHTASECDPLIRGFAPRNNDIGQTQFVTKIKAFAVRQKAKSNRRQRVRGSRSSSRVIEALVEFVRTRWFDYSIDIIIFGNLVAILFEIQAKIDGRDYAYMRWEVFMPLFSCAYLIEMALKMYAYRLRSYFASTKNRYDCVVTIIIFVAEVSIQVHYTEGMNWQWIRMLLLLRFLRCLRLLVALQSLSSMFTIVLHLLPAFTTLYGMLGIVMMEYAAIGVQIFGGKLVIGDARLAKSTFGQSNYYANNFNDYPSAMTTLFELLLVNNWNVIMEGTEIVTSKWSRVYFISFYVIAVVMMLNLVVAFVVEAYFDQAGAQEGDGDLSSPVDKPRGSVAAPSPTELSLATHESRPWGADEDKIRQVTHRKHGSIAMKPRHDSVFIEDFL